MKRILSLCALLFSFTVSQAQNLDLTNEQAFELIMKNQQSIGLSEYDLKNAAVSSAFHNQFAGTDVIYLQQTHLGIPVLNSIQSLTFKNGKLVFAQGTRISNLDQTAGIQAYPAISAKEALRTALQSKGATTALELKDPVPVKGKLNFGKAGIAFEDITAELIWVPLNHNKQVVLAWQFFYAPLQSSDYWLINVDAMSNQLVNEYNLTVYCDFGHPENQHDEACSNTNNTHAHNNAQDEAPLSVSTSNLVTTANYKVVPYPYESPTYPGGAPAVVTNPWTLAPGNATTLGWHNDGISDYTTTRGNNVYAQEDRDDNNNTFGTPATSTTTPDPLNFVFDPDFTVQPTQTTPVQNQQFSITNLFYWNNIIHNISYIYGFDEVSGNFQNNNMSRGGNGNDYVIADAQDAGGTNNANFATPPDGTRPRMQMYLWNNTTIPRDGSLDNVIVTHEFAHGISNRLTGGRMNVTCLTNEENMGEGWSDYFALMYTQDWANSTLTTGNDVPRGIGTYAIGQAYTGSGIRTRRFSTNFTVNNLTYTQTLSNSSHTRGELWCVTLWDMTWNIINQTGVISNSLFDMNSNAGNVIALKLVMEGMKLQQCNPGFISGRDAILAADEILYGGAYKCAIFEAFRRRGMGMYASEGSTDNLTDQTPDYTHLLTHTLSQGNLTQVEEGQQITYVNTIEAPCSAISNYLLTDTLPANVTYVSGGTYDAVNRVVSWNVNLAAGETQTYSFVVTVNNGSYYPTATLFEETVTASTISTTTWSNTGTPTANVWRTSTTYSTSASRSLYAENYEVSTDMLLQTNNNINLPAGSTPFLNFKHRYNTEAGWDGGVVEISVNNGAWQDLGDYMTTGKYNSILGSSFSNVLTGRNAYSGEVTSFQSTAINLSSFAGQNIKFRFRFGTDNNTAPGTNGGWYVDDIYLINQPLVIMRSTLFDNNGVNVSMIDSILPIVETTVCNDVTIATQPQNATVCAGNNATFSVTASGTAPNYQWQVSTNGGTTWSDVAGATTSTLIVNNVAGSDNNNQYRVVVSNSCPSSITSSAVVLTVQNPAMITTQPAATTVCSGNNATFSVTATGTSLTYQWQVSTDGGTTWTDVAGATSADLSVSNVQISMNGNQYRVNIGSCAALLSSNSATLTINESAVITAQPVNETACSGQDATFSVTVTGSGVTYQWQVSTDGGTTWNNIAGATGATYTITGVTGTDNNNRYRVIVNNACSGDITSGSAVLTVSVAASITTQPTDVTLCEGQNAVFSVTASGSANTYQWEVSTDGGATWTSTGVTTSTLTLNSVTAALNNNQYRVIVFSCAAPVVSNSATLSITELVTVTAQPANVTACEGNDAVFEITVSGDNPQYQWQISTDGGTTWTDIAGAIGNTYTETNVTVADNGNQYRVVLSNSCTSTFNSAAATLTISATATIATHPANQDACAGTDATFTVTASGSSLAYQWQVSTDGGTTWNDITGATNATHTVTGVSTTHNGNQYRVLVTSCSPGVITSNSASLTVNEQATFTNHPVSTAVCPDGDATFTTAANGTSLTYQWQVSTDGGTTWTDIAGATNTTHTETSVTTAMHNNRYRVVINGLCTNNLSSDEAVLSVTGSVSINTHPASTGVCENGNIAISVSAQNAVSYQWQVSTDGGTTWTDITGAVNASLDLSNVAASDNNNQYRVVINGACDNITSNVAVLSVHALPTVVANGPAAAVCSGTSVTLSGSGAATYTWDNGVTDGVAFTISSTTTYTVTGTDANNCSATDNITVNVNPLPIVTISAPTTEIEPGGSVTLTAVSNPAATTFTWYKGGNPVPGETGSTLVVTSDEAGLYTASAEVNDCAGVSNELNITVREPNFAFITPNPNNGFFQVRVVNNADNMNAKRLIVVYDTKGARVFAKYFTANASLSIDVMDVDMRNVAAGNYMLAYYENGIFIKAAQVHVNR